MPDISMCANQNCPKRNECYRYTATPNPLRQSYGDFLPKPGDDQCEYFWPNDTTVKFQPG